MFPAHSNFSIHITKILQLIVPTHQLVQHHIHLPHNINPHVMDIVFYGLLLNHSAVY